MQNLKIYDEQASALSASYNSVATIDLLPDFSEHILSLPDKAAVRVLDLGCGSGRDAYWTAGQGVGVVAVDGSQAMLTEARTTHSHHLINYIYDEAPGLLNTRNLNLKFDIVLMNAFLFHFDAAERQEIYNNLQHLLRKDSFIFLTLRHGPVPAGRVMHPVPLQELEDLAQEFGGKSFYHGQKPDPLKRPGVYWDHLSLRL